jgi:hypothetical protein
MTTFAICPVTRFESEANHCGKCGIEFDPLGPSALETGRYPMGLLSCHEVHKTPNCVSYFQLCSDCCYAIMATFQK